MTGRRTPKLVCLFGSALLFSACAVGPDYQRSEPLEPGLQWSETLQQAAEQQSADVQQDWSLWWTQYNDAQLSSLVAQALADNLALQQQADRVRLARAQLGMSQASRWPLLSAQASAAREQQPAATFPFDIGLSDPLNQFALAGVLSYEVDLWGRLAREQEAASALLQQSVFAADAVRLNLVTDVVTTYFALRSAQQQQQLLTQTLESQQRTLTLTELRYENGAADRFELQQAHAALATAQAQLPALRAQIAQLESALAILAGYTPETLIETLDFGQSGLQSLSVPATLPALLPSEVLHRRPDVRAAEAGVMAATAGIGVAEAARLPQLNLRSLLGTAAISADDLFSAPAQTWSLSTSLGAPLFDFGRVRAGIDSAEAQRDLATTEYQLTVLAALREARDAMIVYDAAAEQVDAVSIQNAAAAELLALGELRHREGLISLFELLDVQRAYWQSELALTEAQTRQLAASATLFKALGGGWSGH